jgi:hypothetical protein
MRWPQDSEKRAIYTFLVIVAVLIVMMIYGCVTDVQAPA